MAGGIFFCPSSQSSWDLVSLSTCTPTVLDGVKIYPYIAVPVSSALFVHKAQCVQDLVLNYPCLDTPYLAWYNLQGHLLFTSFTTNTWPAAENRELFCRTPLSSDRLLSVLSVSTKRYKKNILNRYSYNRKVYNLQCSYSIGKIPMFGSFTLRV